MQLLRVITLALLALSGCTQLAVNVDIFNKKCAEEVLSAQELAKAKTAKVSANLKNGLYNRLRASLKLAADRSFDDLVKVGTLAKTDRDRLQDKLNSVIDARIGATRIAHSEGASIVSLALSNPDTSQRKQDIERALDLFKNGDQQLLDLSKNLRMEFEASFDPDKNPSADLLRALSNFDRAATAAQTMLISGSGVFDDPNASAIISASDNCWRGVFNQTYGQGICGNSDIAIKMESLGNFTLKGIRVDSRNVTQATFKVFQNGLRLVASVYGLTVPTTAGTNPTPAVDEQTSLSVNTAEKQKRLAEAELAASRQAGVLITDVIVANRANALDANDQAKRSAAVAAIQSAFSAYRPQLVGDAQTGDSK
jgi:hypothetical protein